MKTMGNDTEQKKSARINWNQILGKSASGAAKLFEPVMPATINTLSNTNNIMRDIRNATRASKSVIQRQKNSEKNSSDNKKSFNLFKSAFEDIQSGSFTIDKINDELYDDYEVDTASSFEIPTGDDVVEMSSEEILLMGNKGIAQSVIQGTSAQLRGIQESSKALINSNIKSTQALGLSINNTLQFGFGSINTNLTIQNQKLDNINNNLRGILEFNNKNAIEFYSKAIDIMTTIGKMNENLENSMNPSFRKKARVFDVSNGININDYIDYVKEGYKNSLVGTGTKMAGNAVKDYGILGIVSDFIIPKSIREPLEKFDNQIIKFFDEGFKRLGDVLNKNSFFQLFGLGDIFGSKREKLNSINLGKYIKDATPWNGVAQKALTEVIPELLTSIDSKIDNSEKRYFDYERGQFKTESTIKEEFKNDYSDTFSMALRESMDKLIESVQSTGKSETDQEGLIRSVEALIDDLITQSKDQSTTNREIYTKMKNFGIDDNNTREFITEFTSSIENAISRINDLYHEIGSSNHIYRNINNNYRNEYARELTRSHRNHTMNYRSFSFVDNGDIRPFIRSLQREAGIDESIDLAEDNDFRKIFTNMMKEYNPDVDDRSELIDFIRKNATKKETTEKIQSKFKLFSKIKTGANKIGNRMGNKVESATNTILNPLFKAIYLGGSTPDSGNTAQSTISDQSDIILKDLSIDNRKDIQQPVQQVEIVSSKMNNNEGAKPPKKNKVASTRLTKSTGKLSSKEEKAFQQVNALNEKDYDDYINQSESENDRDHANISKSLDGINEVPPAPELEKSITQSNNALKTFLGGLMVNFKGFTSRLFGKEGFFKKFWESDTRKKAMNAIKEKLFTGDNAIFKKPYEGVKTGLRNLKDKTKEELGKGYDFLYDNTMTYMYGEDYENNEKWQNNKFVSQTLNRKWRAEQKRKEKEAEEILKNNESDVSQTIDSAKDGGIKVNESASKANKSIKETSQTLLALPAPIKPISTKERDELVDRKNQLKNIMSERDSENPEYSNKEIEEATKEWQDIKKKLMSPVVNLSETVEKTTSETSTALIDVSESTKKFAEHTDAAIEEMVGNTKESTESKKKAYRESFIDKLKKTAPKALAGAIAGMGVGMLNNKFSLLGSMFLPGGPVAGAIVGGGLAILTQTEAFKTFMFGKQDPQSQKREGGLINEKMQQKFKKMLPYAVGGAVVGGLKGLVTGALGFNNGLGILGMQILPGGILGGAMMGAAMGILKNSEGFKKILFGEKDNNGKRSGTILSNSYNKMKGGFSKLIPGFSKAATGLGVGALTGAVLSNAGYIPAMLSLGGPVGMGVVGLGIGIASSTKKFNEWMFGSEELDENGNPTGKRRKDGILTRVKNILMTNVVEPIGDAFKSKMLDLVDWTKDKITYPFRLAFGPILDSMGEIKDNIVDFVKDKFDTIGNGIMDIFSKMTKSIFKPITKLVGVIGKSVAGMASSGTKLALAPLSVGLQAAQVLTAGKRRSEYIDFYKNYYSKGNISEALRDKWDVEAENGKRRGLFGKVSDTIGAYIGHGEIADAARTGWNNQMAAEGKNHLNWRSVTQEKRQMHSERDERRANEKQWRKIDKYRTDIINKDLDGREVTLNDYQFERYRNKFKKLGISEEYLQSSDDIMDLLYRRNEFKKRLDPTNKGGGLVLEETPEQKEAREKTEAYQNHMKEVMDKIAENMGIAAKDLVEKRTIQSATEEWEDNKRKLHKRLKKNKIKNVDINIPEIQDFDISEVDDDKLRDYRFSKYYSSGDFLGFMKAFGITQKSKYVSSRDISKMDDSIKTDNPEHDIQKAQAETLERIADTQEKLLVVNTEQKDIDNAQLEIATNGEFNDDEIKKKRGRNLGPRIASKFNSLTSYLGFKRKQKKIDAEAEESKAAQEGNDKIEIKSGIKNDDKDDDDDNPLGNLLKSIKNKFIGLLGVIGGSKVGGMVIKGAKVLGGVGLLSGLTIGIMEMIKPGTQDKILKSTEEITNSIEQGDFYEDYVKPKLNSVLDFIGNGIKKGSDWFGENFPEIFENHILPMVQTSANLVAKNASTIVDIMTTIVTALVPPIAEAMVDIVPTVVWSFTKAIYNATIGKQFGFYPFGKPDEIDKIINDSSLPDPTDKEALAAAINKQGKATYYDAETGKNVTVTGASATIDENGNVSIHYNTDSTLNNGAIDSVAKGFLRGSIDAGSGGIRGKAGRIAAKIPFNMAGSVIGSGIGTSAGMLGGPIGPFIGGATGGAKGAKYGGKIGDKVVDNTSVFLRNAIGQSALSQRIGEGFVNPFTKTVDTTMNKGISSLINNKNITISAEELHKSIQEATNNTLSKLAKGGAASSSAAVFMATEEASEKVISESIETAITTTLKENNKSASSKDAILRAIENTKSNLLKETGTESYTDLAKTLSGRTVKEVTEETMTESVKKSKKGIVKKTFEKIGDAIAKLANNDKLKKLIGKFTADTTILGKFIKGFKEFLESVFKHVFSNDNLLMKVATRVADGAADIFFRHSPIEIVFAAYDLANGAYNAENLFMVPKGEADWLMRLISACMEFVLGLPIICIFNIILEVVQSFLNKNWKCDFASKLYTIMAPEDGGLGLIGDKGLSDMQISLEIATEKYNTKYGTNITVSEYNDKTNKGIFGTIFDAGKASINGITNFFSGGNGTNYKTKWNSRQTVTQAEIDAYKAQNGLGNGLGYGSGPYAQGDPRWAKMPIGMLPDGSIATMERAGCGPTALAAVANTVADRTLGYGPVSPADIGAYATSNGYISQGGANAGLFTEGAERLGLSSSPVTDTNELKNNLLAGRPTILTGKSNDSSDPYTNAGHIVMADGIDGNKMNIMDPITGKHKMYDIDDVSRNTEHAWAYSTGYGPDDNKKSTRKTIKDIFNIGAKSSNRYSIRSSNRYSIRRKNTQKDETTSMIEIPSEFNAFLPSKKEMLKMIFEEIGKALEKLISNKKLEKIVAKFTADKFIIRKIILGFKEILKFAYKRIFSNEAILMKVSSKIASSLAQLGLRSTPLEILFSSYDIVTGALDADELFMVPKSSVDWVMRMISSCMKFILGLSPIYLLNIIFDASNAIFDKNWKCEIATNIYNSLVSKDTGFGILGVKNLNSIQIANKIRNERYETSDEDTLDKFEEYVDNGGFKLKMNKNILKNTKQLKFNFNRRLGRGLGYGPVSPADIGAYATSNGYISDGGANAGLFTEGAERLGLSSSPISDSNELRNNLLAGKPTILTGKSNGSSDPYTGAGHIVMADGIDGNNMSVLDPITGKHKIYDINDVSRNTEHAWAYSTGYGPVTTANIYSSGMRRRVTNRTSNSNTTNAASDKRKRRKEQPTAGIYDYGKVAYNTEASGIDRTLVEANYNFFESNDLYYHKNYKTAINTLKTRYFAVRGRDGKVVKAKNGSNMSWLRYVLSTQYFGLHGGTWGSVSITPQYGSGGNYLYPNRMTKAMLTNIFAAAIIAENQKKSGGMKISSPLSPAEKRFAYCNACRIMYGLANTIKYMSENVSYANSIINSVNDSEVDKIVKANTSIGTDIVEEVSSLTGTDNVDNNVTTTPTGIMNAEQLRAIARGKGTFGKIKLLANIAQAKINAILNGTDFWTEFAKLTSEDTTDNSNSIVMTGISSSLSSAISNPQNIQEELLGKTIEQIYRAESGGNYASVINDTGGKASVGPYHANAGNAAALLRVLQNAQGIPSDLRKIYGDYSTKISQGKTLSDSERKELSAALGDEDNADEIKKVIDREAMRFQNDYYQKYYAGYFDSNIIKDLRTLPMLADIGNTGAGHIINKGDDDSFIHNWTPTSKEKDFEAAYELLNSPKVYWKQHKYAKGYMNRIKATHDNLKNYTFKRAVEPGQLQQYFAKTTNPLGFGPIDKIVEVGDTIANKVDNSEKVKKFSNMINSINDKLIDHLSSKTGISPEDLGIKGFNNNKSDNSSYESSNSNYAYNGSYDISGEQLTSLSGTDRDRFIAAAKSQIGYLEKKNSTNLKSFTANAGNNSYTKYAQEIGGWNGPGAHWCNFFTSWAAKAAGIPSDVVFQNGRCTTTMNHYKNKGLFKSIDNYTGKPGDLVFFNWNKGRSEANHIGIVTGSNGNELYTIEGNTTNNSGYDAAAQKTRKLNSGTIIGFATPRWTNENKQVNPSSLLKLGYGDPKFKHTKIDSPAYREQQRKTMERQEDFKVSPKDFEAVGFGPGMVVDAGFDMSNTDSKLDQIFSLMAEWFDESKKSKAAQSSATTNVNMVKVDNTNVSSTKTPTSNKVNTQKYRETLVKNHVNLASRKKARV